jgi:ATP adenylyltransferase
MKKLWAPWRLEYIQGERSERCVFCLDEETSDDESRLILHRGAFCFVIMNRYPYSNGHLMVAPYRHLAGLGDLSPDEVQELHRLTVLCQQVLRECIAVQGFNVGINLGEVAGAGVADHLHQHIVPRWHGDTNFMPVFAEVRVVPQHLEATYRCLKPVFATLTGEV